MMKSSCWGILECRSDRDECKPTRYVLLLGLIGLISVAHFITDIRYLMLHELYVHAYYLPVILSAFWYGARAGLLAAFLASAFLLFHSFSSWGHRPDLVFDQVTETVLYHLLALVTGVLSQSERRRSQELETASHELSKAYQKLQETFDQLRRADRLASLGQLSAGIAHEIRNPLGSIRGSVEIIETEITPDHPKHEFVQIIKEETARVNSLVSEFLKFARPPEPLTQGTLINDLIDSTLKILHKQAEKSNVEIRQDLDPSIPSLDLDWNQMRQVLLNILLNAIEAMPGGGIIEVQSFLKAGNRVVVQISDNGPGIEDHLLDWIFDPFFTTKPHGTGLGLSISHQLVENHGGVLRVHKNNERGLTFSIELPLVKEPELKVLSSAPQRPALRFTTSGGCEPRFSPASIWTTEEEKTAPALSAVTKS
ncbi:MAG: hypothetical protein HY645_00130 [Acidobacteria bacterium]|nr:hypothetical protein [Acidobacteriota bacterium]